jgi:uncharacterized protein YuzB (UPF0349 family)
MNLLFKKIMKRNKKMKLEFCQNNLDHFFDEDFFSLFKAFFNKKNVFIKEYRCLNECELCTKRPYVKANGEVIDGENPGELLSKLKVLID